MLLVMTKLFVTMRDFITALADMIWHTPNTLWYKHFDRGSLATILSDFIMKTRPFKTTLFIWKFIPITYFIIHHQRARDFRGEKLLKGLKLLWFDRVPFKLLIDKILFKVLSDWVHSNIGYSLVSSVFFFRHATAFY